MSAGTRLADAERFFHEHAGYSYDPTTETPEQGRRRCAAALAEAEAWGKDVGVVFSWEDDWNVGSHVDEFDAYDAEPETCETALARWGALLASLGCVDDADDDYRRVVQAELADELRFEWLANTPARDFTPSTFGVLVSS
jgi:hypothetical protein